MECFGIAYEMKSDGGCKLGGGKKNEGGGCKSGDGGKSTEMMVR